MSINLILFIFSETYVNFVVAESKLEKFLSENPPNDKNIPKAQEELEVPERQLNDILHSDPPVSRVRKHYKPAYALHPIKVQYLMTVFTVPKLPM